MFPNSPEREKLQHSLGGVLYDSVVSRGSPVVFGSGNIPLLAGFMLTQAVCSRSSIHRRLLSRLPRTGTVPTARPRVPRSGCSLQTAAQLPGSVFPTSGTNCLTTDTTNPINRALPKPPRLSRRSPTGRCHLVLSRPGGTQGPDPSETLRPRDGGMETGPLHAPIPAR